MGKKYTLDMPLAIWKRLMYLQAEGLIRNKKDCILRALREYLKEHFGWEESERGE